MTANVREELHRLVEELPESEVPTARRVLEALSALQSVSTPTTPEDDEAADASSELARRMGPSLVPGRVFFSQERPDLDTLAAQQGVRPVTNFDDLLGDFWPEDETADDFIAAVRQWRREGGCA
jgi:hypothetical protein